jgi:hypothetical protein
VKNLPLHRLRPRGEFPGIGAPGARIAGIGSTRSGHGPLAHRARTPARGPGNTVREPRTRAHGSRAHTFGAGSAALGPPGCTPKGASPGTSPRASPGGNGLDRSIFREMPRISPCRQLSRTVGTSYSPRGCWVYASRRHSRRRRAATYGLEPAKRPRAHARAHAKTVNSRGAKGKGRFVTSLRTRSRRSEFGQMPRISPATTPGRAGRPGRSNDGRTPH